MSAEVEIKNLQEQIVEQVRRCDRLEAEREAEVSRRVDEIARRTRKETVEEMMTAVLEEARRRLRPDSSTMGKPTYEMLVQRLSMLTREHAQLGQEIEAVEEKILEMAGCP